MQDSLLAEHEVCLHPDLPGAELTLWPQWLAIDDADRWLHGLQGEIPFTQHRLRLFGREVSAPRLSCWVGDPGTDYQYSGVRFAPHAWTPALRELRERVQATCGASFNSVLANLYRDGDDAMGWHSDDEPELGPEPVIASVSLGVMRRFRLRARDDSRRSLDLELAHGSLLRMAGATQRNYRHALPRSKRVAGTRLNLTFRHIG
ncbi:alpha-ketoglutarate-dependent dioxygenase AlkB [Oleiagrimonas sp. MCCC 1A03011]|uniref:alpha-ketoglutarate-dependent dioxygenase AlkB family protein n=1 Tax=Oleiagrimonas sp. MCCC 1A03011 TaxID=1926883 RepID=UPI000DC2B50F|nr:alpha-ketoglutarate-dependent dioxygenase AlkB [Oleiagrimonas sp. MCCC 1A03011]RAP58442.1 alpha-ketoglutarate-dependent dioxygenase AlkB [Oleiagrimonas sp. MCCC 1A03011]